MLAESCTYPIDTAKTRLHYTQIWVHIYFFIELQITTPGPTSREKMAVNKI